MSARTEAGKCEIHWACLEPALLDLCGRNDTAIRERLLYKTTTARLLANSGLAAFHQLVRAREAVGRSSVAPITCDRVIDKTGAK